MDLREHHKNSIIVAKALLENARAEYCNGLEQLRLVGTNTPEANQLQKALRDVHDTIKYLGHHLISCLSLWQQSGATIREFCELCGLSKHAGKKRCDMDFNNGTSFVELLDLYQLDYKGYGKRPLSWYDAAPLSLGVCVAQHGADRIKRSA